MTDLSKYRERVAEALSEHRFAHRLEVAGVSVCRCGFTGDLLDFDTHIADALLAPGDVFAEVYQRGYDDGCDDPDSMWTSTKLAYRDQGVAEVRARVEAVADAWSAIPPYLASDYDRGRVDQREMCETELREALTDRIEGTA